MTAKEYNSLSELQQYAPANFLHQTKFSEKGQIGNCMMTCFANYFGELISQVPPIEELFPFGTHLWEETLDFWMEEKGYVVYRCLSDPYDKGLVKDLEIYFGAGTSIRGHHHLIMLANGEFLFDPHPSNGGVEVLEYWYLKKIERDDLPH